MTHDPVSHPAHYMAGGACCDACGAAIECIQITEGLGFNRGNAVKYVWRAPYKGSEIQDLNKAIWYLQREVARLTALAA